MNHKNFQDYIDTKEGLNLINFFKEKQVKKYLKTEEFKKYIKNPGGHYEELYKELYKKLNQFECFSFDNLIETLKNFEIKKKHMYRRDEIIKLIKKQEELRRRGENIYINRELDVFLDELNVILDELIDLEEENYGLEGEEEELD